MGRVEGFNYADAIKFYRGVAAGFDQVIRGRPDAIDFDRCKAICDEALDELEITTKNQSTGPEKFIITAMLASCIVDSYADMLAISDPNSKRAGVVPIGMAAANEVESDGD